MGKGDKKTARGKRFAGSHGNVRQTGKASSSVTTTQPKKAVAKKAPAKKAAAKKAAAKSA
ncbi:MAG: 30S ribosomal protein THX [Lysobacteraceae bacterium]